MNHAEPELMKALRAHARGGPEQLVYEDAPVPRAPNGSDVLVRVRAAAVTFDELTWDETWEADGVDRTPTIPSHEFSGVVVAVGPEWRRLRSATRCSASSRSTGTAAAAEFVLTPATSVVRKPAGVSDIAAAAAVLPALTAMEALGEPLGLASGQRLLVRGGTGGVGAFVTQFAHRMGLSVTVTVRSSAGVDRARRLGADEVLVGDEPEEHPSGQLRCLRSTRSAPAHPRGCTARFDPVVESSRSKSRPTPTSHGAVRRGCELLPGGGSRGRPQPPRCTELAAGDIEVAVAQVFPLAEGRAAYASRGRSDKPGKLVLDVATPAR